MELRGKKVHAKIIDCFVVSSHPVELTDTNAFMFEDKLMSGSRATL
jgi:hypothetical protein